MGNSNRHHIKPTSVKTPRKLEDIYFIGIISCKRYEDRRIKQAEYLSKLKLNYRYFIGNKDLTEAVEDVENNIVYLPCEDNYESLPQKVHAMISWIYENCPNVEYMIKMDDDVKILNYSLLYEFCKQFAMSKSHYAGSVIKSVGTSFHHAGKSDTDKMDKIPVKAPKTTFAQGSFYYLSRYAMKIAIDDMLKKNTIFEDQSLGHCLKQKGISPLKMRVQTVVFFPK
jgi:hypothetical protein